MHPHVLTPARVCRYDKIKNDAQAVKELTAYSNTLQARLTETQKQCLREVRPRSGVQEF